MVDDVSHLSQKKFQIFPNDSVTLVGLSWIPPTMKLSQPNLDHLVEVVYSWFERDKPHHAPLNLPKLIFK